MFLIFITFEGSAWRILDSSCVWHLGISVRKQSTAHSRGRGSLREGPRDSDGAYWEKNTLSAVGRREPRVIKNSVQRPQHEDARLWGKQEPAWVHSPWGGEWAHEGSNCRSDLCVSRARTVPRHVGSGPAPRWKLSNRHSQQEAGQIESKRSCKGSRNWEQKLEWRPPWGGIDQEALLRATDALCPQTGQVPRMRASALGRQDSFHLPAWTEVRLWVSQRHSCSRNQGRGWWPGHGEHGRERAELPAAVCTALGQQKMTSYPRHLPLAFLWCGWVKLSSTTSPGATEVLSVVQHLINMWGDNVKCLICNCLQLQFNLTQ